ncbi:MAG TPA: basic secretory protein-like protein [Gemmataceae bacterium]|nr:basic secretory protein-like protein [Gemmataceae bacterium]
MRHSIPFSLVLVPLFFSLPLLANLPAESPLAAIIETTLPTDSEHIRQLAFDGDDKTYFASAKNPTDKDHFTFVLDKPVAVRSLRVSTGRPDGGDKLDAGTLQVSADGKTFEDLAKFNSGVAEAKPSGRKVQAIRVKPNQDLKYPLVIREIVLASDPAVVAFKYPVEFTVDVSDAPEMKEWAEKAARVCEQQYTMINEELKDERFQPPRRVRMRIRKMNGVAYASGGQITGSASYFKDHPKDIGAMVHETVHIVQSYRVRGNPGWLVEGIADYVRFFKYDPGNLGRINPRRARYDGSYRVTAAFLAYLTEKYDKDIVRKLNKMMREGEYKKEAFQKWTGKTLEQLGAEWRATLGDSTSAR